MDFQVGRFRGIHLESNLINMVDMRYDFPMGCQVVMFLDNLRFQNWVSHLDQNLDLM